MLSPGPICVSSVLILAPSVARTASGLVLGLFDGIPGPTLRLRVMLRETSCVAAPAAARRLLGEPDRAAVFVFDA